MSILGNLLDLGNDSTSVGATIATDPQFNLSASDILHVENGGIGGETGLTGIGDLGIGLSAPTFVGVNVSNELTDSGQTGDTGGGLLGGLL